MIPRAKWRKVSLSTDHPYQIANDTAERMLLRSEDYGWLLAVPGFKGFLQALTERICDELDKSCR